MSKDEAFYYKDEKRYDRITRILGFFQPPFLVDWIMRVGKAQAKRIANHAAKIGTRVGELIEKEWKEGVYKFKAADDYAVKNCMKAWADFKRDHQPEILDMEVTEYDEELGVAGTRDIRCRINGVHGVLDLKSSKSIHLTYWIQTVFYRRSWNKLAEARGEQPMEECWILRLDKETGMYEFQSLTKAGFLYEEVVNALCGLVNVFRFFTKHDKEIAE